jgi:hypothetical protein
VTAELRAGAGSLAAIESLPTETSLGPPRPNPANGEIEFSFALTPEKTGRYVLEVFDVRGRRILRSEREVGSPGIHSLVWNGRDSEDKTVGPGIYFFRVKGSGFTQTRRVTIVR